MPRHTISRCSQSMAASSEQRSMPAQRGVESAPSRATMYALPQARGSAANALTSSSYDCGSLALGVHGLPCRRQGSPNCCSGGCCSAPLRYSACRPPSVVGSLQPCMALPMQLRYAPPLQHWLLPRSQAVSNELPHMRFIARRVPPPTSAAKWFTHSSALPVPQGEGCVCAQPHSRSERGNVQKKTTPAPAGRGGQMAPQLGGRGAAV